MKPESGALRIKQDLLFFSLPLVCKCNTSNCLFFCVCGAGCIFKLKSLYDGEYFVHTSIDQLGFNLLDVIWIWHGLGWVGLGWFFFYLTWAGLGGFWIWRVLHASASQPLDPPTIRSGLSLTHPTGLMSALPLGNEFTEHFHMDAHTNIN